MSITSVYSRVSKRADEMVKSAKKPSQAVSGLLARSKMDTSTPKSQLKIDDDIASIIVAIRKQREELINGK